MMRIVGFGQEDPKPEVSKQNMTVPMDMSPVRSLVSINFERMNKALTYYNDRFDLKAGDRVFVTGKLEGEVGIVESVTTKFRIRLSDFQKVVSLAQTPINGTYLPRRNMMLSYDADALSPEDFRQWILPPQEEPGEVEDEVIFGDGYEIPMDDFSAAEGFDGKVMDRAIGYCSEGKVGYVSVRDGVGTAFVHGSRWYEVDFRLSGNVLKEAYCDCPYPGLCKHLLAVAVMLSAMTGHGDLDIDRDFTMVCADRFWDMLRHLRQGITVRQG